MSFSPSASSSAPFRPAASSSNNAMQGTSVNAPSAAVPPRPNTIKLSCKALRALPHRLTHPPPAQGKIPTWGVTPRFDVSLEDILDRKHLPPLGLKDFEEWLLFVERSAENLYFILWLREYTQRYSTWALQSKQKARANSITGPNTASQYFDASNSNSHSRRKTYRTPPPSRPVPSPALALFYLRAKETFLTPNAPYELDVPSDVLSPFHIGPMAANMNWDELQGFAGGYGTNLDFPKPLHPPDPAVFAELAECVQDMLRASLDRFVIATYNNVGTRRALCGSAGGIAIGVVGSVPPLACCFEFGISRWWRLIALPGMWLGMTIFISALYGVCMMIYIFGDLRQLRSFELARPPISSPRLMPSPPASLRGDKPAPSPPREKEQQHSNDKSPREPMHPFPLGFFARLKTTRSPSEPSPTTHVVSEKLPVPVELTRPPRAVTSPSVPRKNGMKPIPPKLKIITPGSLVQVTGCEGDNAGLDAELEPRSRWSEETERTPRPAPAVVRASMPVRKRSTKRAEILVASAAARSRESVASSITLSSDLSSDDDDDDDDDDDVVSYEARKPRIEVSEAYYDENPPPEGPATRTSTVPLWPDYIGDGDEDGTTAGFIRSYIYGSERWHEDLEAQISQRPVEVFNFDELPPRRPRFAHPSAISPRPNSTHTAVASPASPSIVTQSTEKRSRFHLRVQFADQREKGQPSAHGEVNLASPRSVIAHVQSRCSPDNAATAAAHLETVKEKEREKSASPRGSPVSPSSPITFGESPVTYRGASPALHGVGMSSEAGHALSWEFAAVKGVRPAKTSWRERFRRVSAVPAFKSPLTPVLNPVVTRAQWEIVVRSALIALLLSGLVIGALVAVPEPRVR